MENINTPAGSRFSINRANKPAVSHCSVSPERRSTQNGERKFRMERDGRKRKARVEYREKDDPPPPSSQKSGYRRPLGPSAAKTAPDILPPGSRQLSPGPWQRPHSAYSWDITAHSPDPTGLTATDRAW